MEKLDEVFAKYVTDNVVTEEAKKEISVVFEAMVNEKAEAVIEERMNALIAESEEHFTKAVEKNKQEMTEAVEKYMDETVNEFMENNKVAITNSITVEKAKAIITGVQNVFEENGIELPESNNDIISEMQNKINELNNRVDSLVEEKHELMNDNVELQKANIFIQETKNLSLINSEKLLNLMKDLVTESVQDFKNKLSVVKSNLITEKKHSCSEEDDTEDKIDEIEPSEKKEDEAEESRKKKSVKEWLDRYSKLNN